MDDIVRMEAKISDCGRYRYSLSRQWANRSPLTFVMLNPSTADAVADDPTIRKCRGFAERLGHGSIRVVNLFAWRATDPAGLRTASDPVGPDNDAVLYQHISSARFWNAPVVAAWGAHPQPSRAVRDERARTVAAMAAEYRVPLMALSITKAGDPGHPLMLPYTSLLTPWPPEEN